MQGKFECGVLYAVLPIVVTTNGVKIQQAYRVSYSCVAVKPHRPSGPNEKNTYFVHTQKKCPNTNLYRTRLARQRGVRGIRVQGYLEGLDRRLFDVTTYMAV